jgi:hypothetical protein
VKIIGKIENINPQASFHHIDIRDAALEKIFEEEQQKPFVVCRHNVASRFPPTGPSMMHVSISMPRPSLKILSTSQPIEEISGSSAQLASIPLKP